MDLVGILQLFKMVTYFQPFYSFIRPASTLLNRERNISTFEIILLITIHGHHNILLVANG